MCKKMIELVHSFTATMKVGTLKLMVDEFFHNDKCSRQHYLLQRARNGEVLNNDLSLFYANIFDGTYLVVVFKF